jgi:ATP-dependent Clp protease ATP-binding subunit ClpA
MQALQEQVVGQEYAVAALTQSVTLAFSGVRDYNRPLAVLLFLGPTGSGKTRVAQALARVLFGNERKIIYVSGQQLNQATDPLASLHEQLVAGYWQAQTVPPFQPADSSIVVFEEIDKAPPAFRDNLAAAIDRGEIFTRGCFFSLRRSFLILTTQLSKRKTDQLIGRTIGFFRDGETDVGMPRQHIVALEEIDHILGAHLVSRIDEIIIFERLNEQNIITLLERQLAGIERFLAGYSVGLMIDPEAKTFLLRHGLEDLTHGVRQIKRAVRNYLEFPLADLMLSGRVVPGTTVMVKYEAPRSFLNFQIMIPQLVPAHLPLMKPQALKAEAVE